MPVDNPEPGDPVLMGIMAEILSEEFGKQGIDVPFLELPAKSEPDSEERKRFWSELETAILPPD
jgi:hypothetical protein